MKEISIENKKTYLHKFKDACNLLRASFFSSINLKFYIFLKETKPYIENDKWIPEETLDSQFYNIIKDLKAKGYTLDDILIILNTLIKYEYYSKFVFPTNIMYLNCFEYTSKTEFENVKKYKRNRYSRAMKLFENLALSQEQDIDDELLEAENYISKGINFAQQNISFSNEIEDKQENLIKIQKSSEQAKIAIYELNNCWECSKSNSLYDNIAQVEEAISFIANEINNFSCHFNALEKKYFMFSLNDFPQNLIDYNRLTNSSEIRDIYSRNSQDQDKLENLFYSEVIKLMAYDLSLYDEIQDDSLNVDEHISETKNEPSIQSANEMSDKVSEKEEDSTKVTNEEEFTLPDDMFYLLEAGPDEWLGSYDEKRCKKPEKIAEVINHFAIKRLIDDDLLTKQSLAFRLTGRMKPENLIEQIPWHGQYAPLFYFIKKYTTEGKGFYKKFATFLKPDDPKENNKKFSSLPDKAPYSFKYYFYTVFPDVFPNVCKNPIHKK